MNQKNNEEESHKTFIDLILTDNVKSKLKWVLPPLYLIGIIAYIVNIINTSSSNPSSQIALGILIILAEILLYGLGFILVAYFVAQFIKLVLFFLSRGHQD